MADAQITVYEPDRLSTYNMLAISGPNYNNIPARFATYNDIPLGSMPLPNVVETATQSLAIHVSDSGSGTDTAQVVTKIPVSDAGTAADTGSVTRGLITATDAGVGADLISNLRVQVADAEAYTDTEVGIKSSLVTDAGLGTDVALDPHAQYGVVDNNGLVSESASLTVHYFYLSSDTGTAIETVTLVTQNYIISTDVGTSTEVATNIAGLITSVDAGAGVDSNLLIVALPILTDSGSISDVALQPSSQYYSSDFAVGIDTSLVGTLLTVLDHGTIAEANLYGRLVADLFVGQDLANLLAKVLANDFGTISEQGAHYPLTILGALKSGKITHGLDGSLVRTVSRGEVRSPGFFILKKGIARGLDGDVETTITGRVE